MNRVRIHIVGINGRASREDVGLLLEVAFQVRVPPSPSSLLLSLLRHNYYGVDGRSCAVSREGVRSGMSEYYFGVDMTHLYRSVEVFLRARLCAERFKIEV
jgi:hypothetical protein